MKYGFGDLVERLGLGRYLRWGRRLFSRKKKGQVPHVPLNRAQRIRRVLEELGPTFVKFGQVISTRPDLVPPDIIAELSKLQEAVPPFDNAEARRRIKSELGCEVDDLFKEFGDQPLAAGSLGQVYKAKTKSGTAVAVKIRRPGVVQRIERDLSLMMQLAILIDRHIHEARVFDPVGLVSHFSRTIRRELSYQREANSMGEFARLFKNDATLYVPAVHEELSTDSILTMEFIVADSLSEYMAKANSEAKDQLKAQPEEVALNGSRIFMKMAFGLGIFHGDPHPGNIRIKEDGTICLLDYGMVGFLDEEIRDQLADLFYAVSKQDYKTVVNLLQVIGEPTGELDIALLKMDVRDFIDSYYGVSLEKLRVGPMLNDLISILATHQLRCPGDLMLLIRAFVTLEGMGRWLDPDFNMAGELAPFVTEIIKERYNPARLAQNFMSETGRFMRVAHKMPYNLATTLEKLSEDELKLKLEHREMDHLIQEVDRASNRLAIGMVMSALILASALLIRSGGELAWVSVPVFVLSSMLGLWLIYGVIRSGSL